MSDRLFFIGAALASAGLIALALVWPQGLGAPSPGRFARPLAPVNAAPTAAPAP